MYSHQMYDGRQPVDTLYHAQYIFMHRWLSLNHSISHRELGTEPPRHGHGKFHWLDQATVQFGGTFLKSEVYEARALGKAFLFALTLIPYWMVYSQVFDSHVIKPHD